MTGRGQLQALVATLLLGAFAGSHGESTLDCIEPRGIVGGACDSPASLRVELTNTCPQPVFVNLCIQIDGPDWECWAEADLAPRTKLVRHTCWATRRYEYTSCTGGAAECGFVN
ncbi:MAG TPA: hypothetical protein VLA56_07020 [Pseudomonadales bacterium]|nr:hypothetical protein [Pseudomonadales bacterium]